jgi:hypothetical protein
VRGRKTQVERQRIAVAYCRVSTREQAAEGHSLPPKRRAYRLLRRFRASPLTACSLTLAVPART